ncbi:hypothetical protein JL100_036510 (plasmid) [Skermanella mucosa]|uniref:hypothetical protein n=1 Tax=Skermanella mucosa TaxID=1789672 RepID=UPI001E5C496D|nr:hypothetical protein [Skermanella mucosa]UEM25423.1 hypothetical protein JL100_036510 [Skermanella mucosa]
MTDSRESSFRQRVAGRSATGQPEPSATEPPNDDEYRAWGSMPENKGERLDLRLRSSLPGVDEEGEELTLHYLLTMSYTHSKAYGDRVTLYFADRLVTIEGRNLRGFRRDFAAGKADYVQEFNPARWPEQPAEKAIVTKIEIIKQDDEQTSGVRLVRNNETS